MQQKQDTESPGQPHGGAFVPNREPAAGSTENPGQRPPINEGEQNWLGMGPEPQGHAPRPVAPTFGGMRGNSIDSGESIRKKMRELRGGDCGFQVVVGARPITGSRGRRGGLFLGKVR